MKKLYIDYETYSATPIKHGTYKYIDDAEIMLIAFAVDDGPVEVWDFGEKQYAPSTLLLPLENPDVEIVAHNSVFDRNVTTTLLRVPTPVERWRCTMTRALMHSLPGSLGLLSEIFNLGDDAKLDDGKKLVQLFCKPMPKNSKLRRATKETHPDEWARFVEYAGNDILAARRLDQILPKWNYTETELDLWFRDQRMNDRGINVDVELVGACLNAVAEAQRDLKQQTFELTDGALASTTQRDKTLRYILEEFGVTLPDLTSATLERRLADENLPDDIKELLRIRLMVSTSSTAKYKAIERATQLDGRVRGTIQFCGALRTGRAAGRVIQPQNMPSRGVYKYDEVETAIPALLGGYHNLVWDNTMLLTASVIRSTLCAPKGKKLVVSDLSNIEGRKLAWIAGEEWKVNAFADFDAGLGHDLYNLTYAKSFGVGPETVTKDQRQIGKVQELALGYEGGVGAFIAFATAYQIDLEELAQQALPTLSDDVVKNSSGFYDWTLKKKRSTFGLSREAFIVCNAFKQMWRDAHPMTVKLWKEVQQGCVMAVQNPGEKYYYRDLMFTRLGAWLRIRLPSGRFLCYPAPQLDDKGSLSYLGINQYTRKWQRIHTHGGKLVENIVQASSRDVFYHGVALAEDHGYTCVMHVHDEDVTETPDTDEFSAEGLSGFLATVPDWAPGLPLAAGGFEGKRYRKG